MTEARLALENLRKTSQGREVPLFWDSQHDNVLIGKRGKTHTVLIQNEVPKLQMHYDMRVLGDGKLLEEPRQGECETWHRMYWNVLVSGMCGYNANDGAGFGAGVINLKDTGEVVASRVGAIVFNDAVSVEGTSAANSHGYWAEVIKTTSGIVVGTGTAEESFEHFALATQIDHGLANGELYYATSQSPAPDTWVSASRTWAYELSRFFDNFSADQQDITINEMALYSETQLSAGTYRIMLARDLLSPGLAVPYHAQAQITYIFSYPSLPSSGSPLRNWWNMYISSGMSLNGSDSGSFGDGQLNMKDTSDALQSGNRSICFLDNSNLTQSGRGYRGTVNDETHGIQVGSNATPVTFDDNVIGTLIADGSTAGVELLYSIGEIPLGTWASGTLIYTVQHARTFSNGGGGAAVDVKESTMVGEISSGAGTGKFLTHHDVFDTVSIANGENLRQVYQFNTTFPE